MKYADWIENVEPHLTPKGARLDLREKTMGVRQLDAAQRSSHLSAMLEQITPENTHHEVPDAGPVGNEIWSCPKMTVHHPRNGWKKKLNPPA